MQNVIRSIILILVLEKEITKVREVQGKSCAFATELRQHMTETVIRLNKVLAYPTRLCLFKTIKIHINRVYNTRDKHHSVDIQLYLLLVPGTTTAPLSSFFLCKNVANLFLVVGGVLTFFVTAVPSTRSGINVLEEFNDLL